MTNAPLKQGREGSQWVLPTETSVSWSLRTGSSTGPGSNECPKDRELREGGSCTSSISLTLGHKTEGQLSQDARRRLRVSGLQLAKCKVDVDLPESRRVQKPLPAPSRFSTYTHELGTLQVQTYEYQSARLVRA